MKHRRELLKLIGAAPIAADAVKTHAVELLGSPAVAAAATVMDAAKMFEGEPQPAAKKDPIRELLEKQVRKAMWALNKQNSLKKAIRNGMLDADIAGLKS